MLLDACPRVGFASAVGTVFMKMAFFLGALLGMAWFAYGDWTPPAKPDPDKIFTEAKSDAARGRYSDALAKHVWFHHHALKYQPSLYGVRLSFALGAWRDLGAAYPPALDKLKSVRDDTEKAVREGSGTREAFHDFVSINKTLFENDRTRDLFVWLDSNK